MQVAIIAHQVNTQTSLDRAGTNKYVVGVETDLQVVPIQDSPSIYCYHGKNPRKIKIAKILTIYDSISRALQLRSLLEQYLDLEILGHIKTNPNNQFGHPTLYRTYQKLWGKRQHYIYTAIPELRRELRQINPWINLIWGVDHKRDSAYSPKSDSMFISTRSLSSKDLQSAVGAHLHFGIVNSSKAVDNICNLIDASGLDVSRVSFSTDYPDIVAQACLNRNDQFSNLIIR